MRPERLIVIGNGMAGIRAVEDVMVEAPGRYDISVFGAEPHTAYNRIMLSPVLAGEKNFAAIVTHDRDWYARNGVTLHTGARVTAVHAQERILVTGGGNSFAYDKLVFATGSDAFMLPVEGVDLPGVIGFRTAQDVDAMLQAAQRSGKAVVVGGGLLGIEAACALRQRGMDVTLLHVMPHLMERQLDREAAGLLRREIEKRGIEVVCTAETQAIEGQRRVRSVRLKDGRAFAADLVVMAVGIRPNIAIARAAGLACGRAITVDAAMRTSDPHIFAVGECAEHEGVCLGLVAPIYDMTKALAATLAGEDRPYVPAPVSTRLKVSGVEVFSAGDFMGGAECEDVILRDPSRAVYRRLILREGCLIGAVLYGDTADSAFFADLIQSGRDVSRMRDVLIFGRSLCEAA